MKKTILLALAFGAGMSFAEFRAGFARVDATPPPGLPLVGYIKWVEMFDAGRKDEIPLGSMEIKTLTSSWSRVRRLKNGPDHFDVLVTSLAIGDDLAFAGLPCEPFVDIGRAVKAQSPFRMTVFTCLTNGSEGYIASTKAHAEGGYEALSSRFAAPTGNRLVKAQFDQLTTLKNAAWNARSNLARWRKHRCHDRRGRLRCRRVDSAVP